MGCPLVASVTVPLMVAGLGASPKFWVTLAPAPTVAVWLWLP